MPTQNSGRRCFEKLAAIMGHPYQSIVSKASPEFCVDLNAVEAVLSSWFSAPK
jgi:hypothetical protein